MAAIVHEITVTNHGSVSHVAQVFIGPAMGDDTVVLHTTIFAGDTITIDGPIILEPGDKIISIGTSGSNEVGLRASVSELKTAIDGGKLSLQNDGRSLGTVSSDIYICPASRHATIESILVCNTHATAEQTVKIEIVPSGEPEIPNQRILSGDVLAGDTLRLSGYTLEGGDRIIANAEDADTVGVKVSAVEWA